MATKSPQNIVFEEGKLVINPTDLSAADPYGGTELGYTRDHVSIPTQISKSIVAEELGQQIVEIIDGGRAWIFGCTFRGWDDDAYNTLFPSVNTGSSSGRKGILETTTQGLAGSLFSDRSVKLLFVPNDTDRHKMILLHKALPLVDETAELMHELSEEQVVAAIFIAMPDSSGNIYAAELKEDLSLT